MSDDAAVLRQLSNLAETAAQKTGELSQTRLLRWVQRQALPAFDRELSPHRYDQLAAELSSESADNE